MAITNVVAPNIMQNVNQPLPDNLRVMPKPIIGGADLKAITDQHQKVYNQAMNFGRMNPDVILQALGNGGSLSSSFGFNSASDVAGLTPDQLMALTQGRGVDKSLNSAQGVFDAVTGAPEKRAMMLQGADRRYNVDSQMLSQQNSQDLQAQNANAGNQIQLGSSQAQLDQGAQIANAGFANDLAGRREQIASNEKIASQQNARMVDNLKFQMQAHRENLKLQQDSALALKNFDRLDKASNSLIGVLTAKDSSEMNAAMANNILLQHPELNADGTYYEYEKPWFGSNGLAPKKLTPHVITQQESSIAGVPAGTQIWLKPDGSIFSLKK